MFSFFKKNKPTVVLISVEEPVDKDIQLINLLKSVNITDKTLGKVDELNYQIMGAEIESIGMRMVERRTNAVEEEVNSGNR